MTTIDKPAFVGWDQHEGEDHQDQEKQCVEHDGSDDGDSGDALMDVVGEEAEPTFARGHAVDPAQASVDREAAAASIERNKLMFDDVYVAFAGVLDHIPLEQHCSKSIEECR